MLGLSLPTVAERSCGIDPAAVALVARMATPPGAQRVRSLDALVRALRAAGIWSKLSCLYVLAAHDAQAARLNWVQDAYNLTAVNSPGFTPDRGYAGDGSTSYLDTGWSPSLGSQNDLSFGIWVRDANAWAGSIAGALAGSTGISIGPRSSASDKMVARVNQVAQSGSTATTANGSGLSAADRSGTATIRGYRNGAPFFSDTTASDAPVATTIGLGLLNGAGIYASAQFAAAFIGRSLSAAEHAALHAALSSYLGTVGAA